MNKMLIYLHIHNTYNQQIIYLAAIISTKMNITYKIEMEALLKPTSPVKSTTASMLITE